MCETEDHLGTPPCYTQNNRASPCVCLSGPRTVFLFNWPAPSSDRGVSILTDWPRTAAVFSHRVVLGLPRVSTQCVLLNIYAIYRICRQYSHRLSSICLVQLHKSSKFSSVDQVIAACRLCCIYTVRKDEIVFFGCFLYGQFIFWKKCSDIQHNLPTIPLRKRHHPHDEGIHYCEMSHGTPSWLARKKCKNP